MFGLNTLNREPGRGVSWMRQAALLSAVLMVLASSALADQVTTAVNFGPWQVGIGGEFTVTPDAPLLSQIDAGAYSPFTMNQVPSRFFNFQTFCLERNEY